MANMGTTSALDLSGNKNTGWLIGGAKKATGKVGQGVNFDGTSGSVTVPHSSNFNFSTALSFSVWVNMETFSGCAYCQLIDKWSPGSIN